MGWGGVGRGSLVPSCGVEKRGNDEEGEGNVREGERARAEQERSQKGKLKGKDFFSKAWKWSWVLFLFAPLFFCFALPGVRSAKSWRTLIQQHSDTFNMLQTKKTQQPR